MTSTPVGLASTAKGTSYVRLAPNERTFYVLEAPSVDFVLNEGLLACDCTILGPRATLNRLPIVHTATLVPKPLASNDSVHTLKWFDCHDATTRAVYTSLELTTAKLIRTLIDASALTNTPPWKVRRLDTSNFSVLLLDSSTRDALSIDSLVQCFPTQTPGGRLLLNDWLLRPLRHADAIEVRLDAIERLRALPYAEWQRCLLSLGSWVPPTLLKQCKSMTEHAMFQMVNTVRRACLYYSGASTLVQSCRHHELSLPCLDDARSCLRNAHATIVQLRRFLPAGNIPNHTERVDAHDKLSTVLSSKADATLASIQHSLDTSHVAIQDVVTNTAQRLDLSKHVHDWLIEDGVLIVLTHRKHLQRLKLAPISLHGTKQHYVRWTCPEFTHVATKHTAVLHTLMSHLQQRFTTILDLLQRLTPHLWGLALSLNTLDALLALTNAADRFNLCRPRLGHDRHITLRQARHLLIPNCVPNDVTLSPGVALVTGANRAGKSSVIKTIACCILLHQAGSFVPAAFASLPLFDAVFLQRGTDDAANAGNSSFVNQMVSLSSILSNSHSSAFIGLDELGAATSVREGRALATAVLSEFSNSPQNNFVVASSHFASMAQLPGITPYCLQSNFAFRPGVATSNAIDCAHALQFFPPVCSLLNAV